MVASNAVRCPFDKTMDDSIPRIENPIQIIVVYSMLLNFTRSALIEVARNVCTTRGDNVGFGLAMFHRNFSVSREDSYQFQWQYTSLQPGAMLDALS